MFIELTDHLRCPADHAEAYLVLLPRQMTGRSVIGGMLGCPICLAEYPVQDGILELGAAPPVTDYSARADDPSAEVLHTFLGLEGPGGFVVLIGDIAREAEALTGLLPGVAMVAVNPPPSVRPTAVISVVHSPVLPLKQRSVRGLVLGSPEAADAEWRDRAVGAVLPGLRLVGRETAPALAEFELLASAGGWWVGRRR